MTTTGRRSAANLAVALLVATTAVLLAGFLTAPAAQAASGTKTSPEGLPGTVPGTMTLTNVGVTNHAFGCYTNGQQCYYNVSWYSWTPTQDGSLTIDVTSANWDNTLQVWTGANFSTLVANDDDSGGGSNAMLSFSYTSGQAYVIGIGSYALTNGTATVEFRENVQPSIPAKPTTTDARGGHVTVNWPAHPPDEQISEFRIYTYDDEGEQLGVPSVQYGSATSATVYGLANEQAYTFKVVAVNPYGVSAASPASDPATPRAIPAAPDFVAAQVHNNRAIVYWSPVWDDGGSPITGYTARALVNGSPTGRTCTSGGSNSCTITGLDSETEYTFDVRAENALYQSAWTTSSEQTTLPIGTDFAMIQQHIQAGPRNVSVTDLPLGEVGYSFTQQTTQGSVDVSIEDLSGSDAGWHLTMEMTPFAYTGESQNADWISGDAVEFTAVDNVTSVAGRPATDVAAGVGGPLGWPRTVLSSDVDHGQGSYTADVDMEFNIPARSSAGSYEGTLILAVVAGP